MDIVSLSMAINRASTLTERNMLAYNFLKNFTVTNYYSQQHRHILYEDKTISLVNIYWKRNHTAPNH
jgi:hypothetical protein